MAFHEEAFEGAVEIVSAAMEEAEVELSKEGGEQVGEFFAAIYKRLRDVAEDKDEECGGSFEVSKDEKGEYRFTLKASNGQMIAMSDTGYSSLAACMKGIESVKKNAAGAVVKEI